MRTYRMKAAAPSRACRDALAVHQCGRPCARVVHISMVTSPNTTPLDVSHFTKRGGPVLSTSIRSSHLLRHVEKMRAASGSTVWCCPASITVECLGAERYLHHGGGLSDCKAVRETGLSDWWSEDATNRPRGDVRDRVPHLGSSTEKADAPSLRPSADTQRAEQRPTVIRRGGRTCKTKTRGCSSFVPRLCSP